MLTTFILLFSATSQEKKSYTLLLCYLKSYVLSVLSVSISDNPCVIENGIEYWSYAKYCTKVRISWSVILLIKYIKCCKIECEKG